MFEKNKKFLVPVVVVVCLVGALAFVYVRFPALFVGKGTETFSKEYGLKLTDYDGHTVRLSQFRNKILIAYAWASWCPYCARSEEHTSELQSQR